MNTIRKMTASLTAFLLFLTIVPIHAQAENSEEEMIFSEEAGEEEELMEESPVYVNEYEEYGLGGYEPDGPSNDWVSDQRISTQNTGQSLPTKYDSRDLGIISGIRDQGSYGTCWAHSAIACVETYMIKNEMADPYAEDEPLTDINLSETQLAWYSYTDAYDRMDMLEGDVTVPKPNKNKNECYLDVAGSAATAGFTMMRGEGPATEQVERLKYSNADEEGYGADYAYTYNSAQVKEMINVPSRNRDGVKEMIMEYGAGVMAYYHHRDYFNADKTAYCCTQQGFSSFAGSNHLVAIVGWDDNYSRENFNENDRPANDGAWLIKGSWGTDIGDNGYYYISYEDKCAAYYTVYFYEVTDRDTFDNIYQYDGTPAWQFLTNKTGYAQLANMFTARSYEEIKGTSIFVRGEGLQYSVSVYTGTEYGNPVSGKLMRTVSGTFRYSGYHFVEIPAVRVDPWQNYSIVFTITCSTANDNGEYFFPGIDADYDSSLYTANHDYREGVSYYRDSTKDSFQETGNDGNLRIKAYTSNLDVAIVNVSGFLNVGEEGEIFVDHMMQKDIAYWNIISGSLPEGMHEYVGLDYISIYGKPQKAGTYEWKSELKKKDGSFVYYTVTISVISDEPVQSSEMLLLPVTKSFERVLYIDGSAMRCLNAYVKSGSIPPGTDFSEGDVIPGLSGAPHKNGYYDFVVLAVGEDEKTYEHKVRTAVYNEGSPISRMTADLAHGRLYISIDAFESYVLHTLKMLASDGRIDMHERGNFLFVDLDNEGSTDIQIHKLPRTYELRLAPSSSLRREYKFTLNQNEIDYYNTDEYFKEITFLIPFKPVDLYSMDLEYSSQTISLEEYTAHLLMPLYVMERDGQIAMRSAGDITYADLDKDGREDIRIETKASGVTFSAADTNVKTLIEVSTTPAQQQEIASYSWSAKTIRFHLPEEAESYGFSIDGTEVTTRNKDDILHNGVFTFDGVKTLNIKGNYETDNRLIYNRTVKGLVLNVMKNSRLISHNQEALIITEETSITGEGTLQLVSDSDCAVYVAGSGILRLNMIDLTVNGRWGIAGPNGPNNAMLIISRSKVEAYGTEGAVCDFGRGITIKDCYITKPAGGKISDDHRSIVDIGSNISDTVSIDTEETLSDVFFTKDSVPAVGCHMTVDIGRMAELDETLNKAYKANQVEYRWYRNGVWVSSAETKTFDLTSDSRYAEIYVIVFWDDYHIESTHYQVKEIPFEDVKPDRFFYQPVVWAYYHEPQITTGTDETHFSPNNTCTRGQAVTFLWRAMGAPEPLSHNNPFKDVKADKYYYKAVLWALENNVTTGTSPDTFSPNENVTRGQIVTFLYRAKSEPAVSGSMPFKDVKSGSYCYKPVLWAYQNDITTGTTPSTFSPNDFCTRGQIVTFLYRAVVSE